MWTIAGFNLTKEGLIQIGEKIHREKFRFKVWEGFSFDNVNIPDRILETASPIEKWDRKFINRALKYTEKKISGWIKKALLHYIKIEKEDNMLKFILGLIFGILVIIFMVQNVEMVDITFLTWTITIQRAIMVLIVFVVGIGLGWVIRSIGRRK